MKAEKAALPAPRAAGRVRRVLLVEDSEADAYLAADRLRSVAPGTECEVATRLSEVTTARLAEVDCVIVDLSLPDAHGVEAVVRLRALHGGVPVVVLTGDDDHATATAALGAGAQDYLVKDRVDGDALDRAVRYARSASGSSRRSRTRRCTTR